MTAAEGSTLTMGSVACDDETVLKSQRLIDQVTQLILVVQNDGIDAGVDANELEVQVWVAFQGERPVAAEGIFPVDRTATFGYNSKGRRRREDDVVGVTGQNRLDVAGVPGFDPLVSKPDGFRRPHRMDYARRQAAPVPARCTRGRR